MDLSKFLLAIILTMTCFFSQASWAALINLHISGWTRIGDEEPFKGFSFTGNLLFNAPSESTDMAPIQFISGSLNTNNLYGVQGGRFDMDFSAPLSFEIHPGIGNDPYRFKLVASFTNAFGDTFSLTNAHNHGDYDPPVNIFENGTPFFTLAGLPHYNEGSDFDAKYNNTPTYAGLIFGLRREVPEPTPLALLLLGAAGLLTRKIKFNKPSLTSA